MRSEDVAVVFGSHLSGGVFFPLVSSPGAKPVDREGVTGHARRALSRAVGRFYLERNYAAVISHPFRKARHEFRAPSKSFSVAANAATGYLYLLGKYRCE